MNNPLTKDQNDGETVVKSNVGPPRYYCVLECCPGEHSSKWETCQRPSKQTFTVEVTTAISVPLEEWNRMQDELQSLRRIVAGSPGHLHVGKQHFTKSCSTFIDQGDHCIYCGFDRAAHGMPSDETPQPPSNPLLQYLRGCADLAEARGDVQDGLAYVSPIELRKAIAEIERLTRQLAMSDAGGKLALAERDRLRAERDNAREALRISEGYVRELSDFRAQATRLHAALTLIAGTGPNRTECASPRHVAAQALEGVSVETEKAHD